MTASVTTIVATVAAGVPALEVTTAMMALVVVDWLDMVDGHVVDGDMMGHDGDVIDGLVVHGLVHHHGLRVNHHGLRVHHWLRVNHHGLHHWLLHWNSGLATWWTVHILCLIRFF